MFHLRNLIKKLTNKEIAVATAVAGVSMTGVGILVSVLTNSRTQVINTTINYYIIDLSTINKKFRSLNTYFFS